MNFIGFGKIPRLFRCVVVTEKIDGTNAVIAIEPVIESSQSVPVAYCDEFRVYAGSRSRWLSLSSDNHGFAAWVVENAPELVKLGPGRHFGEWWGQGINRGYGLKEKRFSLFNVKKWGDPEVRPACCGVVPVLYTFESFDTQLIKQVLFKLKADGSHAAPGYMNPEGIVVYHEAGNVLFKVTLENDERGKDEELRAASAGRGREKQTRKEGIQEVGREAEAGGRVE